MLVIVVLVASDAIQPNTKDNIILTSLFFAVMELITNHCMK